MLFPLALVSASALPTLDVSAVFNGTTGLEVPGLGGALIAGKIHSRITYLLKRASVQWAL